MPNTEEKKSAGKRKRTYNTRLIKDDYSYYVEQVADLFSVDVATVRRWICKEGLERLPKIRPHLIHSSDLKIFHEARRAKRKNPCAPNEVFCCRCQMPRVPQKDTGSITPLPNHCVRFKARCSGCGGIMLRNIRAAGWNENHPLATFLGDAIEEHSGAPQTLRECSLQEEDKSCLNITR
jgi:hypothetical protein